jgi:hypothetical protein
MTINLDLVIDAEEDSVDMKAGLETMQGVSDAIRCTAEAILSGATPKRQHHKGKVRTSLKENKQDSHFRKKKINKTVTLGKTPSSFCVELNR